MNSTLASYVVRLIVAVAICWWLGQAINEWYVRIAGRVAGVNATVQERGR